ncbi:MAG TPA: ABC transporter permease [Vicinamibacterales bacterium]
MSSGPQSTSVARPQPARADVWVIDPDLYLGFAGRAREVWRYRRILLFFAVKAVQALYANTKLGVWWLLVRPIAPVVVGTIVFGRFMRVPSDGLPYFLFFLTGSIIWGLFAEALTRASRGLEVNRQLLTKLYLPRMILPAGQLAAGLVEPLVLTGVLVVTIWYYRATSGIWYGVDPVRVPAAIAAALLAIALAFGVSLWTSIWQARARDARYMLGYVISFWFFLTPVIYPLSAMPPRARWAAFLNPMTGPVEAFRWALLGVGAPSWEMLALSCGLIVTALAGGLWYFTATENVTVDRL